MGPSYGDVHLLERWRSLLAPWGAPDGEIDGVGESVLRRWAEPHRRYHTMVHLREVLAAVDTLADLADDQVAVELAAWFHDAVYEPEAAAGANEGSSAELASSFLSALQVPRPTVGAVGQLILSTATHEVDPNDRDGAVLTDADLWILGASPERYRRYAADVRVEFGFVDDDGWRIGRSAVLCGFIDRSRLFATDRAQAAFGARAWDNVRWELATLGGGEAEARVP